MDFEAIDGIAEKAREAYGIPGLAIAAVHGDHTFTRGYGGKELGKDDPVDDETLFAVGSVTKAFTTTAMAMLVDEGKMAWDDHPRKHVPGFKLHDALADANVTLRDLVAHRTGLGRHDCLWYNSAWSSEELLAKLPHLPLTYSFRSAYQYNNLMYMVAGLAVESASGMPWADFVRTRILEPLGMTRTTLSVNDLECAGNYCTPHEMDEDKVVTFRWSNLDSVNACGSIISCARDLSAWIRFQLGDGEWKGKRLVSQERLAETHSPQMVVPVDEHSRELAETTLTSYCLGWNLLNYRDWTIIAHGGSIDGFNAGVALAPRAGLGVAILSNLCADMTIWSIRNAILDHFLGLAPRNWTDAVQAIRSAELEKTRTAKAERLAKRAVGTSPHLPPAGYVGDYSSDGYGVVSITEEDNTLSFYWNNHRARLEHWHFDTFSGNYEPPDWPVLIDVVFGLEPDGQVGSLRLIWPNSGLDHTFRKVK